MYFAYAAPRIPQDCRHSSGQPTQLTGHCRSLPFTRCTEVVNCGALPTPESSSASGGSAVKLMKDGRSGGQAGARMRERQYRRFASPLGGAIPEHPATAGGRMAQQGGRT